MDNTALVVFSNEEFGKVRGLMFNGIPYFAGKDIAEALEYQDTDKAIREHVDDDDKLLFKPSDLAGLEHERFTNMFSQAGYNWRFVPADIPNRGMYFINESGLYSLILSSRLPKAKQFRKWITSEVLPSIRKTGGYNAQVTAQIPAQEQLFKFMDKLGSVNDPGAQLALIDMFRATIQNTQPNLASPDTITMEDLFYSYVVPTSVIKRIPKGSSRDGYSVSALYQYVHQNFRNVLITTCSGSSGTYRRESLVSRDHVEDIIKSLIEYNTSDLNAQL